MEVTLKPVTKNNYEDICDLEVLEEQQDYVAENMWSLVESMYNPHYQTRAIYCESEPVGFLMWVPEQQDEVSIWRFMVDMNYQQRGIGRKALQLAIDEIKCVNGVKKIVICYYPENSVSKEFYSSFGFVEVGTDEDSEDIIAELEL